MTRDTKYLLGAAGVVGVIMWDHKRRAKNAQSYGAAGAGRAVSRAASTAASTAAHLAAPCTYERITRDREVRGARFFTPAENRRKRAAKRFKKLRKEYRGLYSEYNAKADAVVDAVDRNRAEADALVHALRTGDTRDENMQMAHWLIYDLADGRDDGFFLNHLGPFITPKLRRQVKAAVEQYYVTTTALDDVLDPIRRARSRIGAVVQCATTSTDKLIWASTRPMELLWGYCTEAEGAHAGWITERRQFFRGAEVAEGRQYGPADALTDKRRKWNKTCDRWVQRDGSDTTRFDWPRFNDPNWAEMPHVYRTAATKIDRLGCLVGEHCGTNPDVWTVRSCISKAQSTGAYVSTLVGDDLDYVNTLLNEADQLLAQLREVCATVRSILWDLMQIMDSPGFKRALDAAQGAIMAGGLALAFLGPVGGVVGAGLALAAVEGGRELREVLRAVRASFKDTRSALKSLRGDISGARTQLEDAQEQWNTTPWRRRAQAYIAAGLEVAEKLHGPWEWAQAGNVCSAVFPRISDECMAAAITESGEPLECARPTGSYVPKERLPDRVLDWEGPGGRAISDVFRDAPGAEGERGDRDRDDGSESPPDTGGRWDGGLGSYGELTASGKGEGFKLSSPLGIAVIGGMVWLFGREVWSTK